MSSLPTRSFCLAACLLTVTALFAGCSDGPAGADGCAPPTDKLLRPENPLNASSTAADRTDNGTSIRRHLWMLTVPLVCEKKDASYDVEATILNSIPASYGCGGVLDPAEARFSTQVIRMGSTTTDGQLIRHVNETSSTWDTHETIKFPGSPDSGGYNVFLYLDAPYHGTHSAADACLAEALQWIMISSDYWAVKENS